MTADTLLMLSVSLHIEECTVQQGTGEICSPYKQSRVTVLFVPGCSRWGHTSWSSYRLKDFCRSVCVPGRIVLAAWLTWTPRDAPASSSQTNSFAVPQELQWHFWQLPTPVAQHELFSTSHARCAWSLQTKRDQETYLSKGAVLPVVNLILYLSAVRPYCILYKLPSQGPA